MDRYYIPNRSNRETIGSGMENSEEVPFCTDCMRKVEDGLRATILGLQMENQLLAIQPRDPEKSN